MSAALAIKAVPHRRTLGRRGAPSDARTRPVRRSSLSAASNAGPEMPASAAAARRSAMARSSERNASNSLALASSRDASASGRVFPAGVGSRRLVTTHRYSGDGKPTPLRCRLGGRYASRCIPDLAHTWAVIVRLTPKLSCGRSARQAAHRSNVSALRQAHNPMTPPRARLLQRFVRRPVDSAQT